jgi:hypothetical protein
MSGFIKLYRNQETFEFLKNDKLFRFWCYLQLKATYKSNVAIVGYQQIELKPGQLIFGRKKAAKETGLSEQNIRTCINSLISTNKITIKTTTKFSIISIINWECYQNSEAENNQVINQQSNKQLTNNQPTTNHIQEVKEIKEGKEDKRRDFFFNFSEKQKQKIIEFAISKGLSHQKAKMINAYGLEMLQSIGETLIFAQITSFLSEEF